MEALISLRLCAYEDSIVILFNDGYRNFEPYYYSRNTQHLLCGCIDNDSIPDLITFTEGYIYFIKNNGNRLLDEGDVVMELGATFPFDRIIDMNNDGWNDIFYQNPLDSYLGIYKNNGDGTFSYLNPVGIKEIHTTSSISISVAPNPFTDFTTITIKSDEITDLNITIYDNFGRRIRGFQHPERESSFNWDGKDDSGIQCPAGIYIIEAEGNNYRNFTKVVKLSP